MVNKLIFQGRFVADPELKYTQSQVAVCEFTVAWSEKYKDAETKCFLRCKSWRNNAEFIEKYFSKGQEIVIEGKMVTEQWDAEGEKKIRTICVVDKANFCGNKSQNSHPYNQNHTNHPKPMDDGFMSIPDGIDEELPFQ